MRYGGYFIFGMNQLTEMVPLYICFVCTLCICHLVVSCWLLVDFVNWRTGTETNRFDSIEFHWMNEWHVEINSWCLLFVRSMVILQNYPLSLNYYRWLWRLYKGFIPSSSQTKNTHTQKRVSTTLRPIPVCFSRFVQKFRFYTDGWYKDGLIEWTVIVVWWWRYGVR